MAVRQPKLPQIWTATVALDENKISVEEDWGSKKKWYATVGLNDEGRCVLRLEDGTELEPWQFRKRALEDLFFEGPR